MARLLFIFIALIAASCRQEPQAHFGDFPQPVHVAEVVERDMPLYLEVMGKVDSPALVQVRAQISGRLKTIHVTQGQRVKRGDLLFTIEEAPFKASLDQALAQLKKDEASLQFATLKLERYHSLMTQDYVSKLEYEQFQSEVETLTAQTLIDQAALENGRINLGYCSIYSPMDGKIGETQVDPGNLVSPNDAIALTTIRQLDPIDVRFSLAQKDFQTIKAAPNGLAIQVLLPGETTPHCLGKLYFIDNSLNNNTGTILCKGTAANSNDSLWPGEYVRVRLLVKQIPKAHLIPFAALQMGQEGSFVYVVKADMTVEMRPVDVVKVMDGLAITNGLETKEVVVTDGQLNLRPGSKVDIK